VKTPIRNHIRINQDETIENPDMILKKELDWTFFRKRKTGQHTFSPLPQTIDRLKALQILQLKSISLENNYVVLLLRTSNEGCTTTDKEHLASHLKHGSSPDQLRQATEHLCYIRFHICYAEVQSRRKGFVRTYLHASMSRILGEGMMHNSRLRLREDHEQDHQLDDKTQRLATH